MDLGLVSSRHAAVRGKERGISREAIDVLFRFGTIRPNGRGGAATVAMTAAGRTEAQKELGPDYRRLMGKLDIVAIAVDGVVVTVYRRGRRLKFHGSPFRRRGSNRRVGRRTIG